MVSADMCEHGWPGTGCPECRLKYGPSRNDDLPKLLRAIANSENAKEGRHDVIFNAAANEIETSRMLAVATDEAVNKALNALEFAKEQFKLLWPDELTEPLREVLGMPNFQCGPLAHCYRAAGHNIARKVEDEQAFIIHRYVPLALKYGADWRKHAGNDLQTAIDKAKANEGNQNG